MHPLMHQLVAKALTRSLMEGVEGRLAIDSRDSAPRRRRLREDGGLSSTRPLSGSDAPRFVNTFGGGLLTTHLAVE